MGRLKIVWTQTAVRQRNLIFQYWNTRNASPEYSRKLNASVRERVGLLRGHPEIGVKTEFGHHRVISLGHYSIFYVVKNDRIYITAFWDNRQEPHKLLTILRST